MRDKCEGITTAEEMKNLCKEEHSRIVAHMIEMYKKEILVNKEPVESPTIYIIGGQNASGKSKLIGELGKANSNAVSIIIDDMKAHHPYREYVDKKFPEESEEILHMACFEVFDEVLKTLLRDKYDITIERTLGSEAKTRRFVVEPANYGYSIEMHVTATHEINSLLSSLERFMYECKLKDEFDSKKTDLKIAPRPISIEHHDSTYKNICDVIQSAESGKFVDDNGENVYPKVFIWDRTPDRPTKMYETGDKRYASAKQAMYQGREKDLKRCKSEEEYGFCIRVKNILAELESAEPNSTLSQYKEYCMKFLDEIQSRGRAYIDLDNKKGR